MKSYVQKIHEKWLEEERIEMLRRIVSEAMTWQNWENVENLKQLYRDIYGPLPGEKQVAKAVDE